MDTLTVMRDFLAKRSEIEVSKLTPQATLEELGIDSLLLLELIFECEDQLGVKVPDDITPPKTVQDLLNLVDQLIAGKKTA